MLIAHRTFILARSKATMQEDCRILFTLVENTRDWSTQTRRHTGTPCTGHWSGALFETINSDLPPGSSEGGKRAKEL